MRHPCVGDARLSCLRVLYLYQGKAEEFTNGFNLAIDHLLHLRLLQHNFNDKGIVKVGEDVQGNPRVMADSDEDLYIDVAKAEEFWELESKDGVYDPPARTPVQEYYLGWMPRLLDAIKIRSRSSRRGFSGLQNMLKGLADEVCWSPRLQVLRDERILQAEQTAGYNAHRDIEGSSAGEEEEASKNEEDVSKN